MHLLWKISIIIIEKYVHCDPSFIHKQMSLKMGKKWTISTSGLPSVQVNYTLKIKLSFQFPYASLQQDIIKY